MGLRDEGSAPQGSICPSRVHHAAALPLRRRAVCSAAVGYRDTRHGQDGSAEVDGHQELSSRHRVRHRVERRARNLGGGSPARTGSTIVTRRRRGCRSQMLSSSSGQRPVSCVRIARGDSRESRRTEAPTRANEAPESGAFRPPSPHPSRRSSELSLLSEQYSLTAVAMTCNFAA